MVESKRRDIGDGWIDKEPLWGSRILEEHESISIDPKPTAYR